MPTRSSPAARWAPSCRPLACTATGRRRRRPTRPRSPNSRPPNAIASKRRRSGMFKILQYAVSLFTEVDSGLSFMFFWCRPLFFCVFLGGACCLLVPLAFHLRTQGYDNALVVRTCVLDVSVQLLYIRFASHIFCKCVFSSWGSSIWRPFCSFSFRRFPRLALPRSCKRWLRKPMPRDAFLALSLPFWCVSVCIPAITNACVFMCFVRVFVRADGHEFNRHDGHFGGMWEFYTLCLVFMWLFYGFSA